MEEIGILLVDLKSKFGETLALDNLRSRFNLHYQTSLDRWVRNATESVEFLLMKLQETKSSEESEPLIKAMDRSMIELSETYDETKYLESLRMRIEAVLSSLPDQWTEPLETEIAELIYKFNKTTTESEGSMLIEEIRGKIDQLAKTFGPTAALSRVQERFERALKLTPDVWKFVTFQRVYGLIDNLFESMSMEDATEIANSIKQIEEKYGDSRSVSELRNKFKGKIYGTKFQKPMLELLN